MGTSGKRREVFKRPRKCAWLALRLMPRQKESIRMAAGARELTMSSYLLYLHEQTIGREISHV